MALEELLDRYAELVRASPHNLLSARGLSELRTRHIPEALALARLLPAGPARLVDVGSGGGLPGLVIAAARRDLGVTLVEATTKKADFLHDTAAALGLEVEVVAGRVEALAADRARFDVATARAVADLATLVGWVVPVLVPGGLLYAVKGRRWREEVVAASRALARSGAAVVAVPPDPRACDRTVDPPLRAVIIAAPSAGSPGGRAAEARAQARRRPRRPARGAATDAGSAERDQAVDDRLPHAPAAA